MVLLGAGRSVRAQDANAEPPLTAKSVLAALKQAREAVDDAEVRAEVEAASTSTKTQTSSATPSANTQSNKQPNRNTSNDRITTTSVLETEAPKELLSEQYVRVGVDERVTMHVSGLPLADAVRMSSAVARIVRRRKTYWRSHAVFSPKSINKNDIFSSIASWTIQSSNGRATG